MQAPDPSFAHLVSLACHDLRTPLATVHGFARTLTRLADVQPPADRYLEMMALASQQLGELLDELGLVARIEGGRWEPNVQPTDTLELARTAAGRLDAGVEVGGDGAAALVDREAAERALYSLARAIVRHGGVEQLSVDVRGTELMLSPLPDDAASIVLGETLKDFGAAVGVRALRALGGSVEADGEALRVRLPEDEASS
jgi:signal transduction histidine kinase